VNRGARVAVVAWLITAVYYFYQYALRSAPAVMLPQLSEAFGVGAAGVASIAGLFYYGYSPFSLVAGVALDRFGPRRVIPLGALAVGAGALLFATGQTTAASVGRLLQGAGGVFALIGAVYIVTSNFPASRAATMIGATQMFGAAGGSAGQFIVGPLIASGTPWRTFWAAMGIAGLVIAGALGVLLPGRTATGSGGRGGLSGAAASMKTVFSNPQSWLCGIIAGLLFIPTTILDMTWGVQYLQEGHGFAYGEAVLRSATVPFGWMIGCPLLGFVSDRLGRRKPVIAAAGGVLFVSLVVILYGPFDLLPPYVLGLVAGIVSGAAMLPYTIIKEVNPPEMGGTASGVVNFLNFTLSALLSPVFASVLASVAGDAGSRTLEHYQTTFTPLMWGVLLAIGLTALLQETGTARRPRLVPAREVS
jgi:MFS family permease